MSDKYHDDVYEVLKNRGALGVSVIAKEIGAPPSSLQRWLERQPFFKKNSRAKWDLPERITEEFKETVSENKASFLVTALESQAVLIQTQFDALQSQMEILVNQATAIKPLIANHKASVAKTKPIDKRITELEENAGKIPEIIGGNKDKLSADHYEMLKGVDWLGLILAKGTEWFAETISAQVAELILGERDELSDESIDAILTYKT